MNNKPHKWQKEMHHFADGGSVQWRSMVRMPWADLHVANFDIEGAEYRVKPESVVRYAWIGESFGHPFQQDDDQLKLTITDGKITEVTIIK